MRISDWSSDVCSSDLQSDRHVPRPRARQRPRISALHHRPDPAQRRHDRREQLRAGIGPARNLEAVIAATREVGDMAMARWRGEVQAIDVWHKSHDNPVSDVDLAVDARLKAVLGAMVPEAGWLSEETADNADQIGRAHV